MEQLIFTASLLEVEIVVFALSVQASICIWGTLRGSYREVRTASPQLFGAGTGDQQERKM